MSQRGGGSGGRGNRGGRRPDYGRGQPQSIPGSTSGGRSGGSGGRGRGAPSYGSPSPSFTSPPPTAPAPIRPSQMPSSSSGPAFPQNPATSAPNPAALGQELKEKLTIQPQTAPPPGTSSKALVNAKRPGFGTVGTKIFVKANHFIVDLAEKDIHHYDVSISPESILKKLNREIMSELVKSYRESHLGRRIPAYDGMKSLYTAGALPFDSKEFVIILKDKDNRGGSSSKPRRERKFTVTLKLASKPDIYFLQQFIKQKHSECPQEVIQALDVVLRAPKMLDEGSVVVGRSFFSREMGRKGDLGGGVQYWLGYHQSLRPTQMGMSLNIDITARSFYDPIPVNEFVVRYLNLRDANRPLSDQDRMKVKKALKSLKVEATHMEYPRSYKVTGISREPMSRLTFQDDTGKSISVVHYFQEKYNVRLRNTTLPALQAGSDARPVYLPMEVCKIAKGQRYTKKLNERQVSTLLKATCRRPNERESDIAAVATGCKFNSDAIVNSEFGLHVGDRLARVNARVLPPPLLNYHQSGREKQANPQMGQWNMINKKMVNGARVNSWTCVNFSSRTEQGLQEEFIDQLLGMCISKGMEFNPNPVIPLLSGRNIEQTLVEIHKQCKTPLQLLIIILPDVTGSYGKIKRICETELGIVSQCCLPKNVQRLSPQYMENVSLKINVKVGGRNTVLNDAIQRRIPLVSDVPTIIFGADVTHPSPGEDSSPSIAAVVASMDWPEVTKYRGLVSAQSHREEIIEDLYKTVEDPQRGVVHSGMVRDLLREFRKSTGQIPHRIIFYRDGVSEGQFSQVLYHEVTKIRKACSSLQDGYMPRITFVVVQKRHHTRLFPDQHNRESTDKSGNIKPGTVVDTQICHPTEFDFYLNSHAGIQGTSRPAHYHCLFDENGFTADALQVLTNNLCYTYARCTRSVSIVPPAYYAHLAAFRARYYIEGDTSDTASSAEGGGRTTVERTTVVRALPAIKDNVKDVMFYC